MVSVPVWPWLPCWPPWSKALHRGDESKASMERRRYAFSFPLFTSCRLIKTFLSSFRIPGRIGPTILGWTMSRLIRVMKDLVTAYGLNDDSEGSERQ